MHPMCARSKRSERLCAAELCGDPSPLLHVDRLARYGGTVPVGSTRLYRGSDSDRPTFENLREGSSARCFIRASSGCMIPIKLPKSSVIVDDWRGSFMICSLRVLRDGVMQRWRRVGVVKVGRRLHMAVLRSQLTDTKWNKLGTISTE